MRHIAALPVLALFLFFGTAIAADPPDVQGERVVYAHDGVELSGYLAYAPSLEGPRPGVIIVHEWWGHDEHVRRRADMLAEAGYIALAVDMYGGGKLAEHPSEAREFATLVRTNRDLMLGRFEAAETLLRDHELTAPLPTPNPPGISASQAGGLGKD